MTNKLDINPIKILHFDFFATLGLPIEHRGTIFLILASNYTVRNYLNISLFFRIHLEFFFIFGVEYHAGSDFMVEYLACPDSQIWC